MFLIRSFFFFFSFQVIFLGDGYIHRWIQNKDFLTSLSYKKESKGSETFIDSIQVTKLVSSWNRYWTLSYYNISLIPYALHYFLFNRYFLEPIHISFAPSKGLSKPHISSCFKAPASCWILPKDQFPFQRQHLALVEIIFRA